MVPLFNMQSSAFAGLRRNVCGARRALQCTRKATISSSTIPVVNIAPLMDSKPITWEERLHAGTELVHAASSVGFFYINGHGINEAVLDSARRHTHALFTQLPPKALDALHVRHTHSKARGYQHVGENVTQGRRDQHEAFDLYRDDPIIATDATTTRHGLQGVNPWPDEELPEFRPFFEDEYSVAMLALGEQLCRGLALGLRLPNEHYFEPYFDQSYWSMRLIRYPPGQPVHRDSQSLGYSDNALDTATTPTAADELLGCGRHSDYGCWTIVNQDPDPLLNGCLEAETVEGKWLPVPHRPGCLPVGHETCLLCLLFTLPQWCSVQARLLLFLFSF